MKALLTDWPEGVYTAGSLDDALIEQIVGADLVTARGGRVVVIPLVDGHSTTSTIEKLRG